MLFRISFWLKDTSLIQKKWETQDREIWSEITALVYSWTQNILNDNIQQHMG